VAPQIVDKVSISDNAGAPMIDITVPNVASAYGVIISITLFKLKSVYPTTPPLRITDGRNHLVNTRRKALA